MSQKVHNFITITIVAGLLSAPARSEAGNFWDFLRDAWQNIQSQYYQNNQSSADALEEKVAASAAQAGVVVSPEQYDDYALRLAKTLAMLSPEQQARVFATE